MNMKNHLYFLLLFVLISIQSCKEDEKFAPKKLSNGTILFSVDPGALTGGTFVGVVQPSFDLSAARFSKSTPTISGSPNPNYFAGNAVITVNLSPELTNLTVNLVITATGVRQPRGTYSAGVWSAPLSTLGLNGTAPANNANLVLEFTASSADGSKTTTRMFTVTALP